MSFSQDQIAVGQQVIAAVKSLGLPAQQEQTAELDAIIAGLDESSLRNVDYGDYPASMGGQMSSSRGVFQQISAWGPLADRENVTKSTLMFLTGGQQGQRGLLDIKGWDTMQPWNAVQAVQQSEFSDGSNYKAQLSTAQQFIRQYGAGGTTAGAGAGAGSVTGVATATNAADSSGGSSDPPWWLSLIDPTAGSVLAANGISVGGALGSVWQLAVEALFVMTGLGLVVVGVWRMSSPARQRVTSTAAAAV